MRVLSFRLKPGHVEIAVIAVRGRRIDTLLPTQVARLESAARG